MKIINDQLTVIVPTYNEEACLEHFREETDRFLAKTPVDTTILFINDGSTDKSQEIIEEICLTNKQYQFISLIHNFGLSTAIKAGFDACKTSLLGYIDADVQTTPVDFLQFLEYFPEYDMVNGIRQKRNDKLIKKLSSKIANSYRKKMIVDGIHDTCCPLKIIKDAYAKKVPFFIGMHRFLPALVQMEGGKVKQVPVRHFPRYAGTAKYHLSNRLIGPFIDTFAVIWMKHRYIRYSLSIK